MCSHGRAPDLFIESITSQCPFRAYPCAGGWDDFTRGNCLTCPSTGCPEMGYKAINSKGKASGKYYLFTNDEKPFSCGSKYFLMGNTRVTRLSQNFHVQPSYVELGSYFNIMKSIIMTYDQAINKALHVKQTLSCHSCLVRRIGWVSLKTNNGWLQNGGKDPGIRVYGSNGDDTGVIRLGK